MGQSDAGQQRGCASPVVSHLADTIIIVVIGFVRVPLHNVFAATTQESAVDQHPRTDYVCVTDALVCLSVCVCIAT